jgi:protein TonB
MRFVFGSLAAHALIAFWFAHTAAGPVRAPGEPVLSVGISMETDRTRSESRKPPLTAPAREIRPLSRNSDRLMSPPITTGGDISQETATDEAADAQTTAAHEARKNHILGELQTQLSRHLVYPPLARQRGWQGTVLLALRVESNGGLERVRVRHSSGYDVLDRAAVDSLHRVSRLDDAAPWLRGQPLDVQIPVIYRLTER